jgi:very-short-patch-repair endonuclease
MAACLHTERSVASHRTGARLNKVPNVSTSDVEVTCMYRSGSRNPFAVVHRSVDLSSEDVVLVGLIPTTSLARTVADLFTCLSKARAAWVAEGVLGSGRLSLDELAGAHERYARQGRPATVVVRELLHRLDEAPPLQSELEQRARRLLVATGLPEPERQVPLAGWVEHPAHVDFAYVAERLIVEVDGRSWHSRSTEFELDRRRDNAAQVAGWIVLRFTWRQVTQDPDYVVSTIRSALRARADAA